MSVSAQSRNEDSAETAQKQVDEQVARVIQRAIDRNVLGLPELPLTEKELGVGPTPKELVYTRDTARLYHYLPQVDEVYRVPLLLVMSPVARGYILDLAKGQSFIEYLLQNGHDVYMVDWSAPQQKHKDLDLAAYVEDMLGDCVEHVVADSGVSEMTMVGYCMGGMLSICYNALHPKSPVKNLACFTTPVNGDGMVLFKRWVTSRSFDVDRLVAEFGVVPSEVINASLQALRPLQRNANNLRLLNNVNNDEFVKAHLRFDRWAADQLPFPGALMKEFVNDFIRDNHWVNGKLQVRGQHVDFSKIKVPFLHVAASFDHIVPAAASGDLINLVGSEDKQEIVVKGGHVSLVAGGNAIFRLWPQLDQWLGERAE